MADLAACYFCGAAPEAALVERSVVPDAFRLSDDVGPTVALCPDCAEKLSRVTSVIVDAADAAPETPLDRAQQESAGEASQPSGSEPPATEETADGPAPTGTDQAGAAPDDDAGPQAATDEETNEGQRSVVEGDHSISALEYNKVMRLLQNREFPIDREEIVTVAASAYQVSRYDCDRVIDLAIDRGLIEEADGQLLRPD